MKSCLSKLLRCQSGTSTTEYALIIALIAAAMMLGGDSLRFTADSTFARASLALGASPQTATADGTTAQAATQLQQVPQLPGRRRVDGRRHLRQHRAHRLRKRLRAC